MVSLGDFNLNFQVGHWKLGEHFSWETDDILCKIKQNLFQCAYRKLTRYQISIIFFFRRPLSSSYNKVWSKADEIH